MNNEQFRQLQDDPDELREQLHAQIDTYLTNLTIQRIAGAIERRLGESLNVRTNQFQDMEWPELADQFLADVEVVLNRQYERLLTDRDGGQISRDLESALNKLDEYPTDEGQLMELLGNMMEGVRMVFDRRSHRQALQRTSRLNYAFLAGQLIQDLPVEQVSAMVLEQLEGAQDALSQAWGQFEWNRLVSVNFTLDQLEERLRERLAERLGVDRLQSISARLLMDLDDEEKDIIQDFLGWYMQNETTRQLLLSVISELWVDYLTRVEALRISIGLEAYGQRDPLVQYKGRASEMFQQLLGDIRMGVISRLFTFRPRQAVTTAQQARPEGSMIEAGAVAGGELAAPVTAGGEAPASRGGKPKKKRKRH
jgi:preprotein translocase subunit SecA